MNQCERACFRYFISPRSVRVAVIIAYKDPFFATPNELLTFPTTAIAVWILVNLLSNVLNLNSRLCQRITIYK